MCRTARYGLKFSGSTEVNSSARLCSDLRTFGRALQPNTRSGDAIAAKCQPIGFSVDFLVTYANGGRCCSVFRHYAPHAPPGTVT